MAVTFAATLIDQWCRRGVRHVIVSPGSRSTPLVIGLQWVLDHQGAAAGDRLRAHVVLDERSAAFQAVGVARATGAPAVLVCTSGTAAVEYHPAVVEAHLAALPVLICTADRPPELLNTGAPQTIDQRELYGPSVRAYLEPGPPETSGRGRWRALADEAFDAATGARPGPVQLNLGFREPLVGAVGALPAADSAASPVAAHSTAAVADSAAASPRSVVADDQPQPQPQPQPQRPRTDDVDALIARCSGRRVVVIAGERATRPSAPTGSGHAGSTVGYGQAPAGLGASSTAPDGQPDRVPRIILDAAESLGWPVLADPLSGLRLDQPTVVPNFDPMLRSAAVAAALLPEVVVRLGGLVSSKVTGQWLSAVPDQIAIDPAGWFPDPHRVVTHQVQADPAAVFEALTAAHGADRLTGAPAGWAERWRRVSKRVEVAVEDGRPRVVEAAAVAAALDGMPDGGHLVVSSSMPVRDLEWFGPRVPAGVTVHSNRGANGIDGVVATAVGVARTGVPTAAVVGDLAILHDIGSLVSASAIDNLAVIVVDNDGGGIFSFLPQQRMLPEGDFERWWGTPSGLDLGAIGTGFGLDVVEVQPSVLANVLRRRLTAHRVTGGAAGVPASPTSGESTAPSTSSGGGEEATRISRTAMFRVESDRSNNLAEHQRLLDHLVEAAETALEG